MLGWGDAGGPDQVRDGEDGAAGDDHAGLIASRGVYALGQDCDGFFGGAAAGGIEGLVFAGDFGEHLTEWVVGAGEQGDVAFGPAGADLEQQ
ncbi:hypothetical protein EMIT0P228_20099 [Pseudomonas brassicacearum]